LCESLPGTNNELEPKYFAGIFRARLLTFKVKLRMTKKILEDENQSQNSRSVAFRQSWRRPDGDIK
jgi:hypothetical protein